MSTNPDGDGQAGPVATSPERTHRPAYQELWMALARRKWTSLVMVPADAACSSADVAKSLAEVGKELVEDPVTAITVSRLGYDSARALSDLQQYVMRAREAANRASPSDGSPPIVDVTAVPVDPVVSYPPSSGSQALALVPSARLLISIPSVVDEPLGLAVAQFADAVVLTVHLGKTRAAEAQRTIDLIGRERIIGCVIVE